MSDNPETFTKSVECLLIKGVQIANHLGIYLKSNYDLSITCKQCGVLLYIPGLALDFTSALGTISLKLLLAIRNFILNYIKVFSAVGMSAVNSV